MAELQIVRLTDRLGASFNTLYKTGGFALAFGFAGIIMMLGAKALGQDRSLWLMLLGALLTFSCFGFFLYSTVQGNIKAKKTLRDNKAAIDALQDISIQLTHLVSTMQAYSFKNLNKINEALKHTLPGLLNMPFVGDKIRQYGLDNASMVSQAIVDYSDKIEKTVNEVQQALEEGDHTKLASYSAELSDMVNSLRDYLRR